LNGFGFVDGLNLALQNHWNGAIKNAFCNEWKCKCFSSQAIVWGPSVSVIYAYVTAPGSCYEIRIAQELCARFLNLRRDYPLIAASAFTKLGSVGDRFSLRCRMLSGKTFLEKNFGKNFCVIPRFLVWGKLLSGGINLQWIFQGLDSTDRWISKEKSAHCVVVVSNVELQKWFDLFPKMLLILRWIFAIKSFDHLKHQGLISLLHSIHRSCKALKQLFY
jgi:hypothetical protein